MSEEKKLPPMKDGVGAYWCKKFPSGIGYYFIYADRTHKQRMKRGFRRRVDAKNARAKVLADLAADTYIDPNKGKVTVKELGKTWLAGRENVVKASTYKKNGNLFRIWVEPDWGEVSVNDIAHSEVQQWVTDISEEVGAGTVRDALSVLRMILDMGVQDKRIPSNPCKDIRVPLRRTLKRRVYLKLSELQALADEADRRKFKYGTLVLFMGLTGLRFGEATALRVRDIDFGKARVTVRENAVWVGGKLNVGLLKNGDEQRIISYPRNLLTERLREAVRYKDADALVFERPDSINDGHDLKNDDYMRPPDSRTGWFRVSVRKADGVPDYMTPHDLRHTAVSLAIHFRANPKLVQRIAGHRTFSQTMETYADLYSDDLDAYGAALDYAGGASD